MIKFKILLMLIVTMGLFGFYRSVISQEKNKSDSEIMIEWITIEGGTFQRGNAEGFADEKPIHTVTISTFEMSKYEITNIQYCLFLNEKDISKEGKFKGYPYINVSSNLSMIKYRNGGFVVKSGKENQPITKVTYCGAKAFCEWVGGRLPTEAEWEYAARGGNQSKGYIYSGSNDLDMVAWYFKGSFEEYVDKEGILGPKPVGLKKPNELGLYDMTGNVREWCSDFYREDYYQISPKENPQGVAPKEHQMLTTMPLKGFDVDDVIQKLNLKYVVRGSDLCTFKKHCSVSNRAGDAPNSGYSKMSLPILGFRCAR